MTAFTRDLGHTVRPRSRSDLEAAGLSPRALAGAHWRRIAHGWHRPAGVEITSAQRIVEAATVLGEGRVSGWAAAYVLGADALDGRDPFSGAQQPVRMLLAEDASHRSVPGVRGVRAQLADDELVVEHGLTLTGPVRTAADLAREAPSVTEAVVALDELIRAGIAQEKVLAVALGSLADARGARQARAAAALCRRGVRSPWETRLRMLVLDLGLPEPEINVPVFDLDGHFLGAPDLLDVEAGVGLEFDGAGHRERGQHREDNVREEGLERAGLAVVRADSLDMTQHRRQLGGRIQSARTDALRHRRLVRWTLEEPAWWRGMPA